jgi:hypothetical protein
MSSSYAEQKTLEVPSLLRVVPIQPASSASGLEICFLERLTPDPVSGVFVLIRQTVSAKVVMGCLRDASGRVIEWLELSLQRALSELVFTPRSYASLSNRQWDKEWESLANETEQCDPGGYISTPYIYDNLRPILVSHERGESQYLVDDDGAIWSFCSDDALLQSAGLIPYGLGRERYLVSKAAGRPSRFVLVSERGEAVEVAGTREGMIPLEKIVQSSGNESCVFWDAPRLMVRRLAPIAVVDYMQMLDGVPWRGVENGKLGIVFGGAYAQVARADYLKTGAANLLAGKLGRTGALLELLQLKLLVLREMLSAACRVTRARQAPLLNLNEASFAIRLPHSNGRLPLFWSAETILVQPGDAMALVVPGTSVRLYQRRTVGLSSVYQPESMNGVLHGTCSFRLLRVSPATQEGIVVDATVMLRDIPQVSSNTLLWIQLPLASGAVDLYGYLSKTAGSVHGDMAFRSLSFKLEKSGEEALRAAEGAALSQAPFSLLSALSSPADLYSLGVIATQMLLVNSETTLPFALDALLKAASEVNGFKAGGSERRTTFGEILGEIISSNAGWIADLGPQRLTSESMSPESATELVPVQLWWDTLAFLIKLFPGKTSESFCRDFEDADDAALDLVYHAPMQELDELIERSRAALLCDWAPNMEIARLLQKAAEAL